jgi:hypothetical protein
MNTDCLLYTQPYSKLCVVTISPHNDPRKYIADIIIPILQTGKPRHDRLSNLLWPGNH